MKKRLFYLTLIYFVVMLTNLGTIKAEEPDIEVEYEGSGKAVWAFSDSCVTRQVGKVFGVKITLINSSIGNRQAYFVIRNNNALDILHIPTGKEGELSDLIVNGAINESKSNNILELSGTFNSDFDTATGESFKNNLNNESVKKILKIFFGDNYINEINNSRNDNAYFKIEPIYAFESCDYDFNNYPWGKPEKFFVVGTTRTIRNAIINAHNSNVFKLNKDNIPKHDIWRFVYGFSLSNDVTIGKDTYTKVNVVDINLEDNYVLNELDKIMYNYWDYGGYGLNIMKVKDFVNYFVCDYNNYEHFKNNILYGPNNSTGGADGKTNCCKDESMINQGGTHFYIDHPECIEPAEYVFEGAKCNYTQSEESTLKVKDKVSSNIWGKIFASMYNKDSMGNTINFFTKKVGFDVTLVCDEDIKITYPAFVNKTIARGGFFIWPRIGELRINSTVQCRPYVSFTVDSLSEAKLEQISHRINEVISEYELNADFKLKYTDPEYGEGREFNIEKIKSTKSATTISYDKDSYDDITNNSINELKSKIYEFNAQTTYKLPTTYRFQNKETLKYVADLTSATKEMTGHYNDRNEGVLPVSFDTKKGDEYSVTITFTKIGGNKNINMSNVKNTKNKQADPKYTCEYEITDTDKGNSPCLCPSGTLNSGVDITKLLCEANKELYEKSVTSDYYSCPKLQKKYCDDPNLVCKCDDGTYLGEVTDKSKCDSLKKSCNSDNIVQVSCGGNDNILISQACNDDVYCKEYFCNIDNPNVCRYECPSDSVNAGKDITKDVFAYISNNNLFQASKSYNAALNSAYQAITNKKGLFSNICWNSSGNIVYRTISLDNPFPGKTGDGRLPGTNWYEHSEYLDKNTKILSRNQSVSGNNLYTTKDPMYVIHLTPITIKEIRKYNSKNEYDDFNLDCKSDNNGKCISKFLHNLNGESTAKVTLSGTCANATTASLFDSCAN